MKILKINNFEEFQNFYKEYQQKIGTENYKNTLFLFIASDDPEKKESWCSDCRKCKPIIDKAIEDFKFNDKLVLAIVQVGQKDTWKTDANPFKTHELQIKAVPTLLSLSMGSRLVEAECADSSKVNHLISNSL